MPSGKVSNTPEKRVLSEDFCPRPTGAGKFAVPVVVQVRVAAVSLSVNEHMANVITA